MLMHLSPVILITAVLYFLVFQTKNILLSWLVFHLNFQFRKVVLTWLDGGVVELFMAILLVVGVGNTKIFCIDTIPNKY